MFAFAAPKPGDDRVRALLAALDRVAVAAMGVDRDLRLDFVNRSGARLLAEGTPLRVESGILTVAEPAHASCLANALRPGPPRTLRRAANGRPVMLASEAMGDGALLLLWDLQVAPQEVGPDDTILRQAFDLTPTEAAIARGIARGDELATVATGLGMARTTARTHLERVMAKTTTRRQAELVCLLARLPG